MKRSRKRSREINSYNYTDISRQMTCIRTTIKTAVEVGTSTDVNTLIDTTDIPTYNKDNFIAFLDQEKQNMSDLVYRLKTLDNSNTPYVEQLEQLEKSVLFEVEGRIQLSDDNSLPQLMRLYINLINSYITYYITYDVAVTSLQITSSYPR